VVDEVDKPVGVEVRRPRNRLAYGPQRPC
jgi:hypothetical protein